MCLLRRGCSGVRVVPGQRGLFATKHYEFDDVICFYWGVAYTADFFKHILYEKAGKEHPKSYKLSGYCDGFTYLVASDACAAGYANASDWPGGPQLQENAALICDSDVGLSWKTARLVATGRIVPGDEILLTYNFRKHKPVSCLVLKFIT